jgi:hypothetical protein
MSFTRDLDFGKKYERIFAKLTKKDYIQSEGNVSWDILINNIKYEVKTDKLANKTSHFAIEYEYNNKTSGIHTSTADYWTLIEIINYNKDLGDEYDYKYNMYIIPKQDLINIILDPKIFKEKKTGGDFNKSKFYLLNKTYLQDYKIKDYNKEFYIYKPPIKKEYNIDELEEMFNSI